MAGTFSQIHIQTVFAVKYRESLLLPSFRQNLFGYIGQTINDLGNKTLIINGVGDHVHCFFGLRPAQSLSKVMQEVKANSSRWINEQRFLKCRFEWQEGFGAFSYSKSQVEAVCLYIKNQEEHHRNKTFREEYLAMLNAFEVDYDERYIFKEPIPFPSLSDAPK
jgi:REP element-mobilizing transposase RayT